MTKIADKFTDALNSIMSQFSSMLTNTINAQLAVINSRLDDIETRLINQPGSNMSLVGNNAKESLSTVVECTSRIMMELEREKDAKNKELATNHEVSDSQLVETFCEQYLTVKPRVVRVRRVGNNSSSSAMKLCVTLDSEETAHDLLESADSNIRKVYFSPYLTKAQATEAYKRRCEKRAQRLSTSATPAESLSASASPFLPSQ